MPITIRTLESMIRLATAHAKLRLDNKITVLDCKVAAELMNKSLFSSESTLEQEELEFEDD